MSPSRILMVDDEEDLELLIKQRFRRAIRRGEIEFLFAHNGQEALEKLDENPDIRLVLSDINMPVMDGLTLLTQLEAAHEQVRAVIISAYGDMANIRTAMNRGAFDFVTKPVDFNDLQITIDKTLSHIRTLQQALENRDKYVAIKRELDVAQHVQNSVLPLNPPESPYFNVHGLMNPAREVGGDFYDILPMSGNRIGLVVADVSDKGVPAALFAMVTRSLVKAGSRREASPARCLADVNEMLCADNDACMFVTLFYGILDLGSGKLVYCNAGHNLPRVVRADGRVEVVSGAEGLALGATDDYDYEDSELDFGTGDVLVLYTDGITEACDRDNVEFGDARLDAVLAETGPAEAREMVPKVVEKVEAFVAGAPQFDDMTCLALRYDAAASSGQ